MLLFSQRLKYLNQSALLYNPISEVIYVLAYPLVLLFKACKITPNVVSILSLFLTILAFISLCFNNLPAYILLWFFAYLLDYADGTLARMTNNVGKSALRVDHICDIVKITLLLLGFGLFFNTTAIWILSFLSSSTFLFYTILNHDIKFLSKRNV